jgi:BirA family transcriptional regulator, biotin operon repressor / biotin---[acetyl-CoA-carboxylase] ligase
MQAPAAGPDSVHHIALETAGSTNAEALMHARAGERGPVWISAKTQTEGRGRSGREWISPPGNLYATLLLTEHCAPAVAPQLAFVAGLGVYDAVAACAPQLASKLALKWPNDLLLEGQKLAGILIESETTPVLQIAIGTGVNCTSRPAETAYPATDLAAHGATVTPDILFTALSQAMQRRLAQWNAGAAFAQIRADWLARAAGLGETIRVRLPEREFSGRFEGLDEAGRLLVQESGRITAVTAGDVFGLRLETTG